MSEQFKSVFTRDNPEVEDTRLPGPDLPDIRLLNISPQGVEKLLKDLNPRKASGPDEVPARVIHNLATEVAPALTAIFSQSIETGELPRSGRRPGSPLSSKKEAVLKQPTIVLCHLHP